MPNLLVAGNSTNGGTAITTDTSGTLNIVTGSGSGSNAITIDASQAVVMPGNLTVSGTLTASSGVTGAITSGTAVSASGTSVTFTGIPSGVKRITIMVNGLTTSASGIPIVQIGLTTPETTGYTGTVSQIASVPGFYSGTTGFSLNAAGNSAYTLRGHLVLTLVNSSTNLWVSAVNMGGSGNFCVNGGNAKTTTGVIDRVRITTTSTDTFTAGTINILYE